MESNTARACPSEDEMEVDEECEQKQETHTVLQFEYDEMKVEMAHKEELLKVSLADAEQKHQKALESITQLEEEKSELMHQVNTLHATVQEMGELCQTHNECDELTKMPHEEQMDIDTPDQMFRGHNLDLDDEMEWD